MRPANTSACLFNLSLFHLHSRTHFENLSLYAAAFLAAWLTACPSVRLKDRPPVRRFRAAIAPPPLLGQCYCYCVRYRRTSAHLLCARRGVTACLQPASCANFILHTTAPRSHYIAWLGLLQKKTNDGRSCTDSSEPFSFTLLRLQLWEEKKTRHVVVEARKNYHFCPFAFNRLISQPAAAGRGQCCRRRTVNSPPRRHAPPTMCS